MGAMGQTKVWPPGAATPEGESHPQARSSVYLIPSHWAQITQVIETTVVKVHGLFHGETMCIEGWSSRTWPRPSGSSRSIYKAYLCCWGLQPSRSLRMGLMILAKETRSSAVFSLPRKAGDIGQHNPNGLGCSDKGSSKCDVLLYHCAHKV